MSDHDWMLGNLTVEFWQAERDWANGRLDRHPQPHSFAIPMGGQVAYEAGHTPCTSCGLFPADCCCPGGPEA